MLKIESTPRTLDHATAKVRLQGALAGDGNIAELQRVCAPLLEAHGELTLDLSGVSFIDRVAAEALRELSGRGVVFTGCSPLIQELLKETDR